jgi:hypothetical protein
MGCGVGSEAERERERKRERAGGREGERERGKREFKFKQRVCQRDRLSIKALSRAEAALSIRDECRRMLRAASALR